MGHVGKENPPHRIVVKCCEDLMNQSQDILNLVDKQASQEFENSRPCFKAIIDIVWWLAFQSYAFRSHDEIHGLKYQGNFIKLLKLIGSHNNKLYGFILKNTPCQNVQYTSHRIQKES